MTDPVEVIKKHKPSNLFAPFLLQNADVTLVKHMDYEGEINKEGIRYRFFKRGNSFFQVPFSTHRFVATRKPDLVLVQGFIFPLQVIALRNKIGKKPVILLQHHGETPNGKKKMIQKLADRYVDGYLFSATGNAEPWLQQGIISEAKCFELPSSSTDFSRKDKEISRLETGMKPGIHFLWVGRLNANKDPLTVLKGFEKYFESGGEGFISMIYQDDELLEEMKHMINKSPTLIEKVKLIGRVPHQDLEKWYNTADYFISGSWKEGGSYALTEAIACGCIPIVTRIPAAMNAIGSGRFGFHFEPGNVQELVAVLKGLNHEENKKLPAKLQQHFHENLSAEALAEKLTRIYETLRG